jgi:hypothetical protein
MSSMQALESLSLAALSNDELVRLGGVFAMTGKGAPDAKHPAIGKWLLRYL